MTALLSGAVSELLFFNHLLETSPDLVSTLFMTSIIALY